MSAIPDYWPSRRQRLVISIAVSAVTLVVWLARFPLSPNDIELVDTVSVGLALLFTGGTTFFVTKIDLPLMELGWGILSYSFYIRVLDELAEGPELLESALPGTIRVFALGLIFISFSRTTGRLRASLSERDERLTVLNRVLRHNLRNKLTVIIAALSQAKEHASSEQQAEYAENGLETAQTLSDLGEKLRNIDRILEQDSSDDEPADVNTAVESTVAEFESNFPNVAFTVNLSSEDPATPMTGLEAAIAEIIENACQHNDADEPRVDIAITVTRTAVSIRIQDNGGGIPSDELKPIREGDESALSHSSGVGLWLVHWIIERASGELRFDYDRGQIVTLSVPTVDGGSRFDGIYLR